MKPSRYWDTYEDQGLTLTVKEQLSQGVKPENWNPEVNDETVVAIVKEYKAYKQHAKKISQYGTRVIGRRGFFKGASGVVVRPYNNIYNFSVYVQFEFGQFTPQYVLMDCRDLQLAK